jgi:hypothetical protein
VTYKKPGKPGKPPRGIVMASDEAEAEAIVTGVAGNAEVRVLGWSDTFQDAAAISNRPATPAEAAPEDLFCEPPAEDTADVIDVKELLDPAAYEPDEAIVYHHNVPIDTAEGARKFMETLMIISARNAAKLNRAALETWRAGLDTDDAPGMELGATENTAPRNSYISDGVII